MADETDDKQTAANKPGRMPLKTIVILAAVLVIEGVAITAAFLVAGGPSDAMAHGAPHDAAAQAGQPVEVMVAAERFQNTRSGRPYLYDTEIFVVTQHKHQTQVEAAIEAMRAQIVTDIATIFRRAEPAHLREPELATLTRQIQAVLTKHLGKDADGEPLVQEVLIKKCMQFRADI